MSQHQLIYIPIHVHIWKQHYLTHNILNFRFLESLELVQKHGVIMYKSDYVTSDEYLNKQIHT